MIYKYTAYRVSGDGNVVFPDEIIIDDREEVVVFRKPRIIGCKNVRIRFSSIGSVTIDKHILFADIIIETKGGKEIRAHGFSRSDANEIYELLNS